MHVPAHSIEELIQASPHQALFETLDHWIQLTFPALDRRLIQSGTMTFIGYGELATAKEGDVYDSLIALAPQKHYLSCLSIYNIRIGNVHRSIYKPVLGIVWHHREAEQKRRSYCAYIVGYMACHHDHRVRDRFLIR